VARREKAFSEEEEDRAAAQEKESRKGQREPANALASLLLSVGLVLLVAAFLYVLWSPMKALLLQFALQLRELLSTVQFR